MELEPANVGETGRRVCLCDCPAIDDEELPACGVSERSDELLSCFNSVWGDYCAIKPELARYGG